MSNKVKKGIPLAFAAINPYIESHIISPKESKQNGKDWLNWGDGNRYPEYLQELYENCATLRSIINGCTDYAVGDDVVGAALQPDGSVNTKGETIRELAYNCFNDYYKMGGFAIQVIRNLEGNIAELYWIDMRYLRTNAECDVFWYSEKWGDKYARKDDTLVLPRFAADDSNASSILYVKNTSGQSYPSPLYAASVKAAETERCIDEYHLNAINNGFASSYIVNFNNGVPEDEMREEIERRMNEKFSGQQNAGRVVYSWNDNKDAATTIESLDIQDFGEKYNTLAKNCRQQLFTAFRANPNLFGIPTENNGFNSEEYDSAFALFSRTQIAPAQNRFVDAIGKVLGKGAVSIKPFTLGGVTSTIE